MFRSINRKNMVERREGMPIEQSSDDEYSEDVVDRETETLERETEQLQRDIENLPSSEEIEEMTEEQLADDEKRTKDVRERLKRITKMQKLKGGARRSTGVAGASLGFPALKVVEKTGDIIWNEPQRGLSSLFKGLEDFGTSLIQKNAPWVKYIPYIGPWSLKKAEMSIREREKEAEKKREAEAKKKKKLKKDEDTLIKEFKAAGVKDPKRAAEAVIKLRSADDASEKKTSKAPKAEQKPDDSESEKQAA
jgi:hypothetical protein